MGTKEVKERIIGSTPPGGRPSLSQRELGLMVKGEGRLFSLNKKQERAKERTSRVGTEISYAIERGKRYLQEGQRLTPEYQRFLRKHSPRQFSS